MTLTIHGVHGNDLWAEREGDLFALTATDLATMRNAVRQFGTTKRAGFEWDESQVDTLIRAMQGPQLDDCPCGGPGLVNLEGAVVCPGCVRAYGYEEEAS